MQVRPVDLDKDHATLLLWWIQHNWPVMPREMLPATGFIVEDLAAGFLYKTDSGFAILEFVISNPNSDKDQRAQALDLVIGSLVQAAKDGGFKGIFTSVEHPKLIERYQNHGFGVTDTNMTNLVRRL